MITVNQTGISVALPTIRHELHTSTTGVEWVVNAYVLALGSLVAVGGRLGDRFGRTTMFVLGIVVFAIAAGAAGLASGESTLVIARAIQGAGAAMMQPASTTTVIDTFGEGERGRAMAIYIGVSSAFVAVGPLLGGALTEFVSWRTVFLLNLPIAIAALALTAIVRPANHPDPKRKLDTGGAVLLTVGLAAVVVAIQEGDVWGWSSAATVGALAAGILALAALFVFERRSPSRCSTSRSSVIPTTGSGRSSPPRCASGSWGSRCSRRSSSRTRSASARSTRAWRSCRWCSR